MKKNVALVLSSGGARGMAHIGIIEEILKAGYHINSISGSSMGALIGGIYAAGKLPEFAAWLRELGKMDVLLLMDFALSKRGIIKGDKVFKQIKKFIGDGNIEDLPIAYTAIAADITNGKEVVFDKGNLADAIRASISIPTVFTPKYLNGADLVDGGLINPLPLGCAARIKDDQLFAVNVNAAIPYENRMNIIPASENETYFIKAKDKLNEQWSKFARRKSEGSKRLGYWDLMTGSFALMQNKISETELLKNKPDFLFNISRNACDTLEFYKADELIAYGRQVFHQEMKRQKKDPDKPSLIL
jgi:NTE family protein